MHIGYRSSGGRGEYELVGSQSGFTARELSGWGLRIRTPDDTVRPTGLVVRPGDSGKPRLRSIAAQKFQIGRQIAAMLMLPAPGRDRETFGADSPIVKKKLYAVNKIIFANSSIFDQTSRMVTFDPSLIEVKNSNNDAPLGFAHRWDRITSVLSRISELPWNLQGPLQIFHDWLQSNRAANKELADCVATICEAISPIFDGDPLTQLEALLGIPQSEDQLPAPDEILESEKEIAPRLAFEYRLTKTRGISGTRFRNNVRSRYPGRCLFCGGNFTLPGVRSGIDAAHILAWSQYDLDVISNGIPLCKIHHWAFDASLIMPIYSSGELFTRFTSVATASLDRETLQALHVRDSAIPAEWMPASRADWPNPTYLQRLMDDLAIQIAA